MCFYYVDTVMARVEGHTYAQTYIPAWAGAGSGSRKEIWICSVTGIEGYQNSLRNPASTTKSERTSIGVRKGRGEE